MKTYCVAILLFTLISCGRRLEKEKLYGHYEFSHWSKDTLELMADGTYYYTTCHNDRKLENSGIWKLDVTENVIKFEGFSFKPNELPKGNWHSRIRIEEK